MAKSAPAPIASSRAWGRAAARGFVEACGIEFTSADRLAYPKLSPGFETTAPGIFVVGALAGYPLIKHCMNQGHDVVEFINGNHDLKPGRRTDPAGQIRRRAGAAQCQRWLECLRARVSILSGMSPLQMREFMLDSEARFYRAGEIVFERNTPGSSLFGVVEGEVRVEVDPNDPAVTVPIAAAASSARSG